MDKIIEIEKTVDRENLIYRASKYTYSFIIFQTIKNFGRDVYNGKITLKQVDNDQSSLLVEIMNFKKQVKRKNPEEKQEKKDILKNICNIFNSRERVLDAFESEIFPIKDKGTGF